MKHAHLIYNVIEETDEYLTIAFNGVVGDPSEGNDAKTFANLLNSNKNKAIKLQINSPGGFAVDGLHIHDLLAQHQAEVTTEIYGATASAATIIAQAGKRTMSSNAMMLIHKAWGLFMGNANDLQEQIETLELMDDKIINIYTKKGADKDKTYALMQANNGSGKWISAEEALEVGLIDEIFEPLDAKVEASADLIKNLGLPDLPEKMDKPVNKEPIKAQESSQEEAEAQRSERIRKHITIKQKQG